MKQNLIACLLGLLLFNTLMAQSPQTTPKVAVTAILEKIKTSHKVSFVYKEADLAKRWVPDTFNLKKPLTRLFAEIGKASRLSFEKIGENYYSVTAPAKPSGTAAPVKDSVKTLTGTVYDEQGKPLEGVTIKALPGNSTTISDSAGRYTLKPEAQIKSLQFSLIGYTSREYGVTNAKKTDAYLSSEASQLNDVIVIGYGTQKRKDVTGSISSVNVEDMQKAPVRSFEEALAGRVAGVQVSSGDGQPGAAGSIVIRGNNSVTQDNSPLYVIDGFPIENADNNAINPAEIESIEILKDASATAIYGARGANGVIIITTKKGKTAVPVIAYDAFYGVNPTPRKQKLLSPYEFVKFQLEAQPDATNQTYLKNSTLDDYKNVQGIDWQDQLLRNALFTSHNLAVRGINNGTSYAISGSYLNQDGVIINSGFRRIQGRVVLDQKLSNKVKIGINANYAAIKSYGTTLSQYGGTDKAFAVLSSTWGYRPITNSITDDYDDLVNEDLDPDQNTTNDYRYNPISSVKNELNERFSNNLVVNGYLQYNISKELTLRLSGGINQNNKKNNKFFNSHTRSGDIRTLQGANGPNGSIDNNNIVDYLSENTLTYNKVFNKKHSLNVLGGITYQERYTTADGYSAATVPNEELGIAGLDEGIARRITSSESMNRLLSFLGRINYNYKSKYYLTASYRADGSSKFSPGNKWSYFPSAALSWRLSKEPFMKSWTFISDARIRTSYGVTGNNRVTDFPYLSTITLPTAAYYTFSNAYIPGASLTNLGNKDLKWETTVQWNAGLDLELLNGRISAVADYYVKTTSNLLLLRTLPGSLGYSSAYENVGKVQNAGIELTINTINIRSKKFTWSSNFNISFNRNKIVELVNGQESILTDVAWDRNTYSTSPHYIALKGQSIAQMYGLIFDGLYQYSDFNESGGKYTLKENIPNNGSTRTGIRPGFMKYKDLNADNIVDAKDQTVIGNAYPKHIGGFTNNLRYGNLDLNIFFQWSYGNQIINANRYNFEQTATATSLNKNMFASFANRWSDTNQESLIPVVGGNGQPYYSSRVLEDGSYLRLKTVQLGYTLPERISKKAKIKSARIYVSAQNLYTWTSYSGLDPEVSTYNSALTPGFDYSPYPRAKTLTAGVNLTF